MTNTIVLLTISTISTGHVSAHANADSAQSHLYSYVNAQWENAQIDRPIPADIDEAIELYFLETSEAWDTMELTVQD